MTTLSRAAAARVEPYCQVTLKILYKQCIIDTRHQHESAAAVDAATGESEQDTAL
jgi:hypothetical protein